MMKYIFRLCVMTVLLLTSASQALACQTMKFYNPDKADLVFSGTAIDIDVIYNEPFEFLKPFKKRNASQSIVTFKVDKIIRGDYKAGKIRAAFPFNWFGGPPKKLSDLRQGYKNKATVGVQMRKSILEAAKGGDADANVIGGICSSTFFLPHQRPKKS